MEDTDFSGGYLAIGAAVTAAGAVLLTDLWWVDLLAFLGTGAAVHMILEHYAKKVLAYWEIEDPGACGAHRQMLPPWFAGGPGGRHLCIDPRCPYRPKDRELIDEWRAFRRIAAGAVLFVWLLLLLPAIFDI